MIKSFFTNPKLLHIIFLLSADDTSLKAGSLSGYEIIPQYNKWTGRLPTPCKAHRRSCVLYIVNLCLVYQQFTQKLDSTENQDRQTLTPAHGPSSSQDVHNPLSSSPSLIPSGCRLVPQGILFWSVHAPHGVPAPLQARFYTCFQMRWRPGSCSSLGRPRSLSRMGFLSFKFWIGPLEILNP